MLIFFARIGILFMNLWFKIYPYLMHFIARCGLLLVSVLVIFAFLEVRYDTLRRRDKGAGSVNCRPTVSLRA